MRQHYISDVIHQFQLDCRLRESQVKKALRSAALAAYLTWNAHAASCCYIGFAFHKHEAGKVSQSDAKCALSLTMWKEKQRNIDQIRSILDK